MAHGAKLFVCATSRYQFFSDHIRQLTFHRPSHLISSPLVSATVQQFVLPALTIHPALIEFALPCSTFNCWKEFDFSPVLFIHVNFPMSALSFILKHSYRSAQTKFSSDRPDKVFLNFYYCFLALFNISALPYCRKVFFVSGMYPRMIYILHA